MKRSEWVLCPLYRGKTRLKLLPENVLKNFPLFCPKCRREMLISAEQFTVSVVMK
ncbi:MAG: cysteine-rich KTR domain-containing protein [Butyricicoccus porcorum]|nr:cysteine-rich KTR domain-containing protein [Butyricicoccus porcorum]MDD6986658.1 cysteine-rich KTR domain-containing protein [Butyricicoccus porcorum]